MKFLKRAALALMALVVLAVLLLAGYTAWVVRSVDPNVMPANHGKVSAKFFPGPAAAQPKPLIVAFGGAEGRNLWASKRWEAERQKFLDEGYAFLAIGYFGLPDTPEKLDRIALEGVHAAIAEAAKRPEVDGRCVAVMGGSKGGELALLLASRYPDIDAVAAIVPGNAVFVALTDAMTTSSFSHNGQALPFVPLPWRATLPLITGDKRKVFDLMMADTAAVERALIPVEKINGPVFFLSATHDELWDSRGMSDAMMVRLKAKNFPHTSAHVAIEGNHTEPTKNLREVRKFLAENFKARAASGCGAGS
ncbi:MAG: dienelactone hydrolase family protein [Betaproteobacteria bacterium]|nr:dienelactone hydrolase family protein [Betaproteobacteria bacterium]